MAPFKFEENIREKLQERELQPGKDAWNKLAAQLEQVPVKKNTKVIWMAVAAGMAGVLLVISFLWQSGDQQATPQIVVEEVVTPEINDVKESPLKKETALGDATEENRTETTNSKELDASAKGTVVRENTDVLVAKAAATRKNSNENAALTSEENKGLTLAVDRQENAVIAENTAENITRKNLPNSKEERFVETKVDEVVATIQGIQKVKNTVTVEEIDALLAQAQRDIATHRILNSGNEKIDAMALLHDVETELERSFRNRVFDALGAGFNKVRSAVAQRNN